VASPLTPTPRESHQVPVAFKSLRFACTGVAQAYHMSLKCVSCVYVCTRAQAHPPPAPRPHAHTRTHTRACNLPKSPSAGVNPQCAIPFIALSACTSASDFVTQLQQASAAHGSLEVPNPSSIHIPNPHTGLPCSYLKITIMFFSDIDIIVLFDIRTTFGLMI